jgi:hypothetical protein
MIKETLGEAWLIHDQKFKGKQRVLKSVRLTERKENFDFFLTFENRNNRVFVCRTQRRPGV